MSEPDRQEPELLRVKIRPELVNELHFRARRAKVWPRDVVETALIAHFERSDAEAAARSRAAAC